MAENTTISWAHDTFNPWEGCTRISPACDNCYAADRAHRFGNDHLWSGELRRTSPAYWRQPLKWNREAAATGVPRRVFCASLADVFDNQAPQQWRDDLWQLIRSTPHLTWMLLTKRPQNVARMLPRGYFTDAEPELTNVWLGVTAEDQERADQRVGRLLILGAMTHWLTFVSAEPLLGPLDLTRVTPRPQAKAVDALTGRMVDATPTANGDDPDLDCRDYPPLGLVIAGGESGRNARPMSLASVRQLRDQCASAGVPFHFKQWGEHAPTRIAGTAIELLGAPSMTRYGKKAAGRLLDGVLHDAMPA